MVKLQITIELTERELRFLASTSLERSLKTAIQEVGRYSRFSHLVEELVAIEPIAKQLWYCASSEALARLHKGQAQ